MKISIPEKIKSEIDVIEAVYLETAKANAGEQSPAFVGSIISDKHIRVVPFIELSNTIFENCTHIQYRIVYKNGITEIIKFNGKSQSIYRSKLTLATQQCVRYKTSELFDDSDGGRVKCLEELDKKISEAESSPSISYGDKNLIYYTIFFDKGYIELLNKSILTILKHGKVNFDLLLITDEATKEKIELQPFIKKIKPKYLLLKTPMDGVEASQYKTRIFEYSEINDYRNILFLDCDIICLKDVNTIFNSKLEDNLLYTARNTNLNYGHHKTIHHGFVYLDDKHVFEMAQAKQMPFNAGQFLFKNTSKIQKHFENLNWFIVNWAGEYFFEQAYMNYYFCKAYATDDTILNEKMSIISTTNDMKFEITKNTCLVHFIAPPLDAKTKLDFIDNFEKDRNKFFLSKFIMRIVRKIKTLF
jgi:lipopolysaccharide biosynthesis glycosyltransferase